jgi:hypothetical protein
MRSELASCKLHSARSMTKHARKVGLINLLTQTTFFASLLAHMKALLSLRFAFATVFVLACLALFFSLLFLALTQVPEWKELAKYSFFGSCAALVIADQKIQNQKLVATFGVFRG